MASKKYKLTLTDKHFAQEYKNSFEFCREGIRKTCQRTGIGFASIAMNYPIEQLVQDLFTNKQRSQQPRNQQRNQQRGAK